MQLITWWQREDDQMRLPKPAATMCVLWGKSPAVHQAHTLKHTDSATQQSVIICYDNKIKLSKAIIFSVLVSSARACTEKPLPLCCHHYTTSPFYQATYRVNRTISEGQRLLSNQQKVEKCASQNELPSFTDFRYTARYGRRKDNADAGALCSLSRETHPHTHTQAQKIMKRIWGLIGLPSWKPENVQLELRAFLPSLS